MGDALQALIRTRELLEPGFVKGSLHEVTPEGVRYCVLGAAWSASGRTRGTVDLSAYDAAMGMIVHEIGGTCDADIVLWNNAPERTHAEVLAVFDAAIATLRRNAPVRRDPHEMALPA